MTTPAPAIKKVIEWYEAAHTLAHQGRKVLLAYPSQWKRDSAVRIFESKAIWNGKTPAAGPNDGVAYTSPTGGRVLFVVIASAKGINRLDSLAFDETNAYGLKFEYIRKRIGQ